MYQGSATRDVRLLDRDFLFRYLGISLVATWLHTVVYGTSIDTVMGQLTSWPRHTLVYAKKLKLVKTVLQGVECFWLSILPIPSGVIDKLYSICKAFVWTSKHPPISSTAMCLSKKKRGYGLRDLCAWHSTLLTRALEHIAKEGHPGDAMDSLHVSEQIWSMSMAGEEIRLTAY